MKKFAIEVNNTISPMDMSVLRNLYTPIIGIEATALYSSFIDYQTFSKNVASYFSFKDLQRSMGIKDIELHRSRTKLEAVGLIRSFEKADGVHMIIRVNKPLSIKDFKSNSLLFNECISVIGEEIFERFEYSIKHVAYNKDDFSEVSAKFQDLFDINAVKPKKQVMSNTLEIADASFDSVEEAIKGLPSTQFVHFLTKKRISNSLHSSISHLQNIGLKESSLNEIINYSFNVNGKIVSNHVLTIGSDLVSKNKTTHPEVKEELFVALNSRGSSIDEVETVPVSSGETLEWDELFDSLGEL